MVFQSGKLKNMFQYERMQLRILDNGHVMWRLPFISYRVLVSMLQTLMCIYTRVLNTLYVRYSYTIRLNGIDSIQVTESPYGYLIQPETAHHYEVDVD